MKIKWEILNQLKKKFLVSLTLGGGGGGGFFYKNKKKNKK